jgi:glycosyltransferase involved in cell wall biosynthesis
MSADAVGGVWTFALDLAKGLVPFGVQTTIAVVGPMPAGGPREAARAVPGLSVLPTGLPLEWTAPDAGAVKEAGQRLASLASDGKADVVQLNAAGYAAEASFAAPLVIACHSCVATWWRAVRGGPLPEDFAWRSELTAKAYGRADALVAPSRAFAAATAEAHQLAAPPVTVHNGREPLVKGGPESKRPSFIFTAGRLWDDGKNVAALDRVASRLALPVLAAGPVSGPNGAIIELKNLRTLGALAPPEIGRWLRTRPIFASLALYEPFGLSVLEAAQAGCPLLLSDIPTFRELWDKAALFVDPADDAAITAAVAQLVGDADLRSRLVARARERAASLSVDAMARGWLAIYAGLRGEAAGRPGVAA